MEYLLISNITFLLLYLAYRWGFRHLTLFRINRYYLLFAVIASLLLPFVSFPQLTAAVANQVYYLPELSLSATSEVSIGSISLLQIYWSGVAVMVLWLVYQMALVQQKLQSPRSQDNSMTRKDIGAFSFFGFVHIGADLPSEERAMIELHEDVHRYEWHSLDVMLYAIVRIFWWFNPAVYLAIRDVQENHEFLADEKAQKVYGIDYQYTLVNRAFDAEVIPLTNTFFNQSHIKTRIKMMNSMKTNGRSKLLYLLVAPILVASLWLNGCGDQAGVPSELQSQDGMEQAMKPTSDKVHSAKDDLDVVPEFKGGQDALLAYFQEGFTYPESLKEGNIEGRVVLQFTVNEDGALSDVVAIDSDHPKLEEPAIAFVESMPNWTPGEKDGKPVKVQMALPVMYTMN